MSVPRTSSVSPQRRIPRKPVSPNHAQHVHSSSESPVRGRKPLPVLPIIPDLKIQDSPGSPVRVHIQPHEWSFPTGYTAEFNDSREYRHSRRFSSGRQYFSAQEEPWSLTPPPPPPHLQLDFSHDNYINFSDEFKFPVPGQFFDSLRGAEENPLHHEERMMESSRQSEDAPAWEVYAENEHTTYHTPEEGSIADEEEKIEPLRYHHDLPPANEFRVRSTSEIRRKPVPQVQPLKLKTASASNSRAYTPSPQHARRRSGNLRPVSSYSAMSEYGARARSSGGLGYIPGSPGLRSAHSRASLDRFNLDRPASSVLDLNASYRQSSPNPISLEESNSALRPAVGSNASLLSTQQTLEMYRLNASKTNDMGTQYSFALLLVQAAREAGFSATSTQNSSSESLAQKSDKRPSRELEGAEPKPTTPQDLIHQARTLLKSLADRSYPFAQYYLADGYSSGMFAFKGKPDYERAFPLFVAASKHGHAESGYRAALCYEYGWGCRRDAAKAVQFYRQSASKNHTGSMTRLGRACVTNDLGLRHHREGVKWLRRAQESADTQYNSAPYYLGLLHETGHDDVFKDEAYAAELFTQAAELGHVEAAYKMGDAYELGKLRCPVDPPLSVHYYTTAANRGHVKAMMGVCAWYMIGAEPVLEEDHTEAFEWAKKAADLGYPRAEFTMGYFSESGTGCRQNFLEANMWYTRAAEHGEERAKFRLGVLSKAAGEAIDGPLRTGNANKMAKSASTPNMKVPAHLNRRLPTPPNSFDPRKHSETKVPLKEVITNIDGPNRVSKIPQNLEVPAQQQQYGPRTSSLRSNEPRPVMTGGPRFSLGESPQKPKKGLLKKKNLRDDEFEEGGEVVYVGVRGKDEKVGNVGGGGKEENKKKWFGRWA